MNAVTSRRVLQGERWWRRELRPAPDLQDVAGERKPHPISGLGLDLDLAWAQVPRWAEELIGGSVADGLQADLDEAGWFEARPSGGKRLRDPGGAPQQVRRSGWLARFNPGLTTGPHPHFSDSDPETFYEWDDPVAAVRWAQLSGEPYRTSQASPHSGSHHTVVNYLRDVAVGDLVFVLWSTPGDAGESLLPIPWAGARRAPRGRVVGGGNG